jgi:MFS family permease
MIFGQQFPDSANSETSTATNIKALFSPLFIFMIVCMTMTSISEFGAQQWVGRIFESSNVHPMMILALTAGLMALGRYFAGPLVHAFNPAGVLVMSAIVTTIGLVLLSQASGAMIYVSAAVFALGVTYFWPTMIGFTSEYMPKTGALGMSLMGGAGMFSVSMWNPVIGGWLDDAKQDAIAAGVTGDAIELVAGQATLQSLAMIPGVLIVAFSVLFILRKRFAHK